LPVPPQRAHFLGGGTTNTLPFPPQAGQVGSVKNPEDFPNPLHRAQSSGTPFWFVVLETGFPQYLQKLLSVGMIFPQDGQNVVAPEITIGIFFPPLMTLLVFSEYTKLISHYK
jgi:hypothetical protein